MWQCALKLTAHTGKWMVGRQSFPFGFWPISRGKLLVSGKTSFILFPLTWRTCPSFAILYHSLSFNVSRRLQLSFNIIQLNSFLEWCSLICLPVLAQYPFSCSCCCSRGTSVPRSCLMCLFDPILRIWTRCCCTPCFFKIIPVTRETNGEPLEDDEIFLLRTGAQDLAKSVFDFKTHPTRTTWIISNKCIITTIKSTLHGRSVWFPCGSFRLFFCCSFRGYPVAADFLEAHALEQERFEEVWLQEAEKLRASAWGGHNAIIAYSLMKRIRVPRPRHELGQGPRAPHLPSWAVGEEIWIKHTNISIISSMMFLFLGQ